jgi:hypothetical protein
MTDLKASRRSFEWPIVVALVVLLFTAFNCVPQLRPMWQLLDAGMSAKHPNIDLGSLLAGLDSFRASGFRLDLNSLQQATAANDLPPFNFPYLWLWLAYVPGITYANALIVATVMYAAFGVTLVRLFQDESRALHMAIVLSLFSPSVVLLCERANIDLILFCLVGWAALLLARTSLKSEFSAAAILLLASFLKLFPIAAVLSFLRNPARRNWIFVFACTLVFLVGAAAMRGDLRRVLDVTPDPAHNAYGAKVFLYEVLGKVDVQRHAERFNQWREQIMARGDYAQLLSRGEKAFQLAAVILAGASFLVGLRTLSGLTSAALLTARQRSLFFAGAAVYIASFIVRNSWSYRLVFLTLAIPAVAGLGRTSALKHATFFRILLGIILVLFWITPIYEPLEYFLIHNVLHWLALCGLAFTCGVIIRSSFAAHPESVSPVADPRTLG